MSFDTGSEHVRIEVADQVATIRLDRPKVNALNVELLRAIRQAAQLCGNDTSIAAVVIAGSERSFAAGVDIKEMAAMSQAQMTAWAPEMQQCYQTLARIPKPVIAAVNGWALGGGCELALCADLRFAGDNAVFGQPEVLLGVIPGVGGSQRLPRLIGVSAAKDLIFTGRQVKAQEALELGLVNRVFPVEQTYQQALDYAKQFAHGPALALRAAKDVIDQGCEVDLNTGLAIETAQFAALFGTEDRSIGMQSFIENGPGQAAFKGC